MSEEKKSELVSDQQMKRELVDSSLQVEEPEEIDSGGLDRSDWLQVLGYFLGVMFFIGLFIYMIASGPKGALIGGVFLLAGALLWIVFRYVLKEIA